MFLVTEAVEVKGVPFLCGEDATRRLDSRSPAGQGCVPGDNDQAVGGVMEGDVKAQVLADIVIRTVCTTIIVN